MLCRFFAITRSHQMLSYFICGRFYPQCTSVSVQRSVWASGISLSQNPYPHANQQHGSQDREPTLLDLS
jgi:hypothetical protein